MRNLQRLQLLFFLINIHVYGYKTVILPNILYAVGESEKELFNKAQRKQQLLREYVSLGIGIQQPCPFYIAKIVSCTLMEFLSKKLKQTQQKTYNPVELATARKREKRVLFLKDFHFLYKRILLIFVNCLTFLRNKRNFECYLVIII